MPCNYISDDPNDTVNEKCNPDLSAQKEYIGPFELTMYYNDETLITDIFG